MYAGGMYVLLINHFIHTKQDILNPVYFLFGVEDNQSYWQSQKLTILHFLLVVMDKVIALDIQLRKYESYGIIYVYTNKVLHIELRSPGIMI